MQKLYLKIKDHYFFVLCVIFITWLAQKLLDYFLNGLQNSKDVILYRIVQVLNFKLPIIPFILGLFTPFIIYRIYRYYKFKKNRLRILNANYGLNSRVINITTELNKAVIDNKLKIILSNNIAGDPYKGKIKKGKIRYVFNGKQFEKEYNENELIELP